MIEASVVLDSVSPDGHRLTTFKLRYPRWIHSEFLTHRVFSRNSSSSRAVPVRKRIAEVRDPNLRATPIYWGKNQGGMQADVEMDAWAIHEAKKRWQLAALSAAIHAEQLDRLGMHKQLVNRLLSPSLTSTSSAPPPST